MEGRRVKLNGVLLFITVIKANSAHDAFGWLSDVAESVMPLCSITSAPDALGENLLQTGKAMEIVKAATAASLHLHVPSPQLTPDAQQNLQLSANLISSQETNGTRQNNLCIPELVPSFHAAFGMTLLGMLCVGLACWMLVISCESPEETQGPVGSVHPPSGDLNSKPQSNRKSRPILKSLDGLRTFLVTWIILYHMDGLPAAGGSHWPVHYFFVLSGFILFYVVGGKRAQFDFHAGRAFVARRLARLCPVYFLALFWMAAAVHYRGEDLRPFTSWVAQGFFLQSLFPFQICGMEYNFRVDWGGNTVGWFTSASVLLSICFPILYNHRSFHSGFRGTFYSLFAIVLFRSFIPLVTGNFMCMHSWVLLRLPEYAAGMLSAQLCNEMPKSMVEWKGWALIFDGSLLAVAAIVKTVASSHDLRLMTSRSCHGDYFLTGVFCLTCIAARFAAESSTDRGLLHRLFSSRPMASMAEYSFSAYIIQTAVTKTVPILFKTHTADVMCKLVAIWIFGVIVTHSLERPVLRLVEQRLANRIMSPYICIGSKRQIRQ
jgi:peptidoglycan/LPS O-acetylase OafA/YrhL